MERNYVIIRSDRAGVFFGEFVEKNPVGDKYSVTLKNCRRLWKWHGACSLSQLAQDGTSKPSDCMFTITVDSMEIIGVIEIIQCKKNAVKSIKSVTEWKI